MLGVGPHSLPSPFLGQANARPDSTVETLPIIDLLRCSVKRESSSAVETFFFPAKNLQAASKDPQHAVDFSIGRGPFSLTRGANTRFHNGEQLSYLIPPPTLKNGSSTLCKDSEHVLCNKLCKHSSSQRGTSYLIPPPTLETGRHQCVKTDRARSP